MIHEEKPSDFHLNGPYPNLCATLWLKLHIPSPLSWRCNCIHGELFLQLGGHLICICGCCYLILLLLLVLIPLRTLSTVVAKFTTLEALDLG